MAFIKILEPKTWTGAYSSMADILNQKMTNVEFILIQEISNVSDFIIANILIKFGEEWKSIAHTDILYQLHIIQSP